MDDNKKLNIALFCDAFYPTIDGVVTVVNNYAKILNKRANVFVVGPKAQKYKDKQDYEVIRCLAVKVPFVGYDLAAPKLDAKFLKEMKKRDIDIVHIHSPFNIGKIGVEVARQKNIPVVATMHTQFKKEFLRITKSEFISGGLLKEIMRTFNSCTEVWPVNESTQEVLKTYGYKKPSFVVKSGTEMLPVDKQSAKEEVYALHNIPHKVPTFIFVGRMILTKGLLTIADSLKILNDKGIDFRMIYVGQGNSLETLKQHIAELGLNDKTIFINSIQDRVLLAKYYAASKLVLFPSVCDTDGLVKYEGASQHTPTVLIEGVSSSAGITNGHNGYIAKPTVEGFAAKIEEILKDEEKYQKVCQFAYQDLYRTWDQRVSEAYDRYEYLINKHKQNIAKKEKISAEKKEFIDALKQVPKKKRTFGKKAEIITKYIKRKIKHKQKRENID